MIATSAPYSQYFDKNGDPLDSGFVYFGVPDANPETSPIPAYWDEAGTQPVAQPARTLAGYIVRNGTPARVYVEGAYSQTVRNKKGELVYYAANSEDYSNLPVNVATIEATNGQTNVNLPFSYTRGNNSLAVYLNGSLLLKDRDYIETSETAIQMLNPLRVGPGGADEVTAIGGRLINPSSAVGTVSAAALAAGSGAGLVGYDSALTFPTGTVGERLQATTYTVDAIISVDATALGLVDGDVVVARGHSAAGDGGGGTFRYVAASVQTVDGGMVFAPTAGSGRLIREGWTVLGFNGPVNPMWWGARIDGTTPDQVAVQAMFDSVYLYSKRQVLFPPGICLLGASVYYKGSVWDIGGSGKSVSILKTNFNGAALIHDLRTELSNRGTLHDLGFDHTFTTYNQTIGLHVLTDDTKTFGLYKWQFRDLQFQHTHTLIRIGKTLQLDWNGSGTPTIDRHAFNDFVNITVLASSAFQPFECISFDRGCGPHNSITGGNLFAFGAGSSCIKIGDGGVNSGFGDLLVYGIHMTDAEKGVNLIAPTGVGVYKDNIIVAACQFDGATMVNPIYAADMGLTCRFFPNNYTTAGVNVLPPVCAAQSPDSEFAFPLVLAGRSVSTSNGSATVPSTAQVHSTGYYNYTGFNWSADAFGAIQTFAKSRGALGVHAAVQVNDFAGQTVARASNGASFVPGAQMSWRIHAAPASTSDAYIPMTWSVGTSPDASTAPTTRVQVHALGDIILGTATDVPATSTTRFLWVPKFAGAPTGVPALSPVGVSPVGVFSGALYNHLGSGVWGVAPFDYGGNGTATAVPSFAGSSTGITTSAATIKWERRGIFVTATIQLILTNKGAFSAGDAFSIAGLPVAAVGVASAAVHVNGVTAGVGDTIITARVSSAATIQLFKMVSGSLVQLTYADLTNGSSFILTITYPIA